MTIELGVLIAVVGVVLSIASSHHGRKKDLKTETKEDTTQMTTIIVRLETIMAGMAEIKTELRSEIANIKNDLKETTEKGIKVEQSDKAAWRAIDEIKERLSAGGL